MNRKKVIVICLIAAAALSVAAVFAAKSAGIGAPIALPRIGDVSAIEMARVENWESNHSNMVRTTEQTDIGIIVSALSAARQVSWSWYSAANEFPSQPDYLTIIMTPGGRLSLYGGRYVYVEYVGIYRLDEMRYDEVHQVYARIYSTQASTPILGEEAPPLSEQDESPISDESPVYDGEASESEKASPSVVILEYEASQNSYSDEPYISEFGSRIAEEFLIGSYLHIFTGERIFEDFGEGWGWWYPGFFRLFEIDDSGIPGIHIHYLDAGSNFGIAYIFIDSEFQRFDTIMLSIEVFRDSLGRLVFKEYIAERRAYEFFYLSFDGVEMQLEPVIYDITLAYLRRLTDLESSIVDSINLMIDNEGIERHREDDWRYHAGY